jgi:hypothetical protein
MPSQDGVRRDQRRHLTQDLSSEALPAVRRESTPLGVGQPQAPAIELLVEHAVLFPQVRDDLQLVAIHPACQRHEEDPQPDSIDHRSSVLALAASPGCALG